MNDLKQAFIDALAETPAGIADFLTTPIPEFQDISFPQDKDGAIIANGQLAANVNTLLQAFSGLTLVELLLRIGQHNPVPQGILLALLEYVEGAQDTKMTFIAPVPGGVYYGWFADWKVQINGPTTPESVTVLVNGEAFPLTPGGGAGIYTASWPVPIGEWDAYATAKYAGGNAPEALAGFSVRHWSEASTMPEEGGEYAANDFKTLRISTGNSTNDIDSITATVGARDIALTKSSGSWESTVDDLAEYILTNLGVAAQLTFKIVPITYEAYNLDRHFGLSPSA